MMTDSIAMTMKKQPNVILILQLDMVNSGRVSWKRSTKISFRLLKK